MTERRADEAVWDLFLAAGPDPRAESATAGSVGWSGTLSAVAPLVNQHLCGDLTSAPPV